LQDWLSQLPWELLTIGETEQLAWSTSCLCRSQFDFGALGPSSVPSDESGTVILR